MAIAIERIYEVAKTWDEELDRFLESLDAKTLSVKQKEFIEAATKRCDGKVLFGCETIASLMEEAVRDEHED